MKEFLKHPMKTGSITPSSSYLADKMLENVNCENSEFIVELGPGTGAITKHIVSRLKSDCQFLALEINPEMIKCLQDEFENINIAPISAEILDQYLDENHLPKANHIISGLPWAIFNEKLQEAILRSIVKSLHSEGEFTTFAYMHALKLKPARHFKEMLDSLFNNVEVSSPVWRNFPPAVVYRCHL